MRGAVLMPQSNDNGKNLENNVFMQLNRMRFPSDKISYYQGNSECDFVLQREDNVGGILALLLCTLRRNIFFPWKKR